MRLCGLNPGFVVSFGVMFPVTVRSPLIVTGHSMSGISDAKTVTDPIEPARHSFSSEASVANVCVSFTHRADNVRVPADAVPFIRSNTVPDRFDTIMEASWKLQTFLLLISFDILTEVPPTASVPRIWNDTLFCCVSAIKNRLILLVFWFYVVCDLSVHECGLECHVLSDSDS